MAQVIGYLQGGALLSGTNESAALLPVGYNRLPEFDGIGAAAAPVMATTSPGGGIELSAGGQPIDIGAGDGPAGAALTFSARNISNTTPTVMLLPSAPLELAIMWSESGTSGNLRYVLEAASVTDATSRLADDTAHAELVSNGNPALIRFEPTTSPVSIYFRASSAVGAGSNTLSVLAKVTV